MLRRDFLHLSLLPLLSKFTFEDPIQIHRTYSQEASLSPLYISRSGFQYVVPRHKSKHIPDDLKLFVRSVRQAGFKECHIYITYFPNSEISIIAFEEPATLIDYVRLEKNA